MMEWSDERPANTIQLFVYAGRDGRFTLYEDEGTNYNYEKGRYAIIDFSYDEETRTLTIGRRQGSFDGMLEHRKFNIVYKTPQATTRDLNVDEAGRLVDYDGNELKIRL